MALEFSLTYKQACAKESRAVSDRTREGDDLAGLLQTSTTKARASRKTHGHGVTWHGRLDGSDAANEHHGVENEDDDYEDHENDDEDDRTCRTRLEFFHHKHG